MALGHNTSDTPINSSSHRSKPNSNFEFLFPHAEEKRKAASFDDCLDDCLHYLRHKKKITPGQEDMIRLMALLHNQGMKWISWRDLYTLNFTHGTLKNNFSKLIKMGFVKKTYRSSDAYYVLLIEAIEQSMTLYRMGVNPDDLLVGSGADNSPAAVSLDNPSDLLIALLRRLTYDELSVHNVRLSFDCPGLYELLLTNKEQLEQEGLIEKIIMTPISKDLLLPRQRFDKNRIQAQIMVHAPSNVSISLACSDYPVHVDPEGLNFINACLSRIEERLQFLAINSNSRKTMHIPPCNDWLVTMWHIGKDSQETFEGPAFETTWSHVSGVLYRIYARRMKAQENRQVIRFERQEYPRISIPEAYKQIMSNNYDEMSGK